MVLRSSCGACGRVLLSEEDIEKYSGVDRIKKAKDGKKCHYCKADQEKIKLEKPTTFHVGKKRLFPTEIRARLIKVSDDDLEVLGLGKKSVAELSAYLFNDSLIELIAITRGAQAATLMTRTHQVDFAHSKAVKVLDTVGAGDCFHAGLLAYMHRCGHLDSVEGLQELNQDFLRSALRHAMAAAGVNVSRVGCEPATWEETVEFAKS